MWSSDAIFLPDYDYDCYFVKKIDTDYDYSEKNGNRLPNLLPIECDYTSQLKMTVIKYYTWIIKKIIGKL